jgi:hypothetical protein
MILVIPSVILSPLGCPIIWWRPPLVLTQFGSGMGMTLVDFYGYLLLHLL